MKRAAALMLIAASAAAFGQATLAPVVVTATRTEASPFDVPASVDLVQGDRIHGGARPEINVSESLSLVPGVIARDRQNYAQDLQLSIRGFGARSSFGVRGVRLYVDGIPATMPDGQGQLSHIDLASTDRIEVLRGPFSVLYGNSSGGVMQVFTERGEGAPVVSGSMALGSNGLWRPGLRVTGGTKRLGYAISANHLGLDGWRDHSGVDRDLFNARIDFDPVPGRSWTFVANAVDLRADDPLGLTRAQFQSAPRSADPSALLFDTRKTVRQDQAGAVHDIAISQADALRWMVYLGRRETVQYQAIPVAVQLNPLHPGGVIGLARDYAGTDLRWTRKSTLAGAPFEIVAGLAADRLDEHRQGWQNFAGPVLGVQGALRRDEDNAVWNFDPYLQGQWHFAPRWTLTAGVRHSSVHFDSQDRFLANGNDSGAVRYAATLPVLGVLFAITPSLHAYASFGKGFETPTFNELAYRPDGAAGLNFALRPSRSDNIEAGLKGQWRDGDRARLDWTAAVFGTRTGDELVTQTNAAGRSTFQNAGRTRRRGVELAASARFARDWYAQAAQSWLDARYADAFLTCTATPCAAPTVAVPAGNRIPGTTESLTAFALDWRPSAGWRAGVEARRSGKVFVNDVNSDAAAASTVFAAHAGYVWDGRQWHLAAALRVDNLTDRRYAGSVIVDETNGRYFEPAPGRTWTLKLTGSYAF